MPSQLNPENLETILSILGQSSPEGEGKVQMAQLPWEHQPPRPPANPGLSRAERQRIQEQAKADAQRRRSEIEAQTDSQNRLEQERQGRQRTMETRPLNERVPWLNPAMQGAGTVISALMGAKLAREPGRAFRAASAGIPAAQAEVRALQEAGKLAEAQIAMSGLKRLHATAGKYKDTDTGLRQAGRIGSEAVTGAAAPFALGSIPYGIDAFMPKNTEASKGAEDAWSLEGIQRRLPGAFNESAAGMLLGGAAAKGYDWAKPVNPSALEAETNRLKGVFTGHKKFGK